MGLREKINCIKQSQFVNNTGWMLAERVFQMLVSLTVGMLSARYLGPTNFGIINYVAAFIAFGTPICGLGLEWVLVKAYVDDKQKAGDAIGTALFLEFIVSLVTSAIIVLIVSVSNANDSIKTTVAILESLQLLFKSSEPIELWYNSQLKSKYTSIVKIIAYSVMALYRGIIIILKKPVIWFAFATSIDFVVMGVLFILLYFKQNNPLLRINLALGKELVGRSHHFILSGLMSVAYSQMDKIMLKHMLGDTDVGLYSAAYFITSAWFFIPTTIVASARPIIMSEKNHNEDQYQKRLSQLYASIFWLCTAVAVIISIFPGFVIWLLYGSEYVGGANALRICIWFGIFAQLGGARNIWLLSENKNKYSKHFLFWGVIINLIMNYVLIRPMGINGAALATLITQVFTCLIAPLLYKDTRSHTKLLLKAIVFSWKYSSRS